MSAFLLRSILYYIVTCWGHTFGIRVEADIRRDLFHHMQELSFDYYDRNRTGQLMSRLTADLLLLPYLNCPKQFRIISLTFLPHARPALSTA